MLRIPPAAVGLPVLRALVRTPVFGVAFLAAAPSVYAAARGEADLSFTITLAAVVGAATLGFAVDDKAEMTLVACPTPRATRRLVRGGFIAVAVVVSWVVVGLSARVADYSVGSLRPRLAETVAAAALSFAFAVRAGRSGSDSSGLAAVTATLLAMGVSSGLSFHLTWLPQLGHPLHRTRWWLVAAVAGICAWMWSRDPASRLTPRAIARPDRPEGSNAASNARAIGCLHRARRPPSEP
jgi:hypothetical protein